MRIISYWTEDNCKHTVHIKDLIDPKYEQLQTENKRLREENTKLQELLHFGCQDRTMISVIHEAKVNKEQALKNETTNSIKRRTK